MAPAKLVACLILGTISGALTSPSSPSNHDRDFLNARALANSASGGYAPAVVQCPSVRPTIRGAASLSQSETDWLGRRRPVTVQPMADFMSRANIPDFDGASYINSHGNNASALPNIAIAISGGGYRALMNGAGFIAAADDRTPNSTDTGGIGGLLQATTYLAGLSGGGWLVGSIYSNNFSTVTDLRDGSPGSSVWQFNSSIFTGPTSITSALSYWLDVFDAVENKSDQGYNTSITDYWGRALSYQLINATDGGPAYTFSSFALSDGLTSGSQPMPLLVTDGRAPGTLIISLNATNYEINPWEFGSFDPTIYGFAPTQYLGSNFSAGVVPTDGKCVEGFDQAGYMMGTSSSLFNQFLLANISQYADVPQFLISALESVLQDVGKDDDDIAQWEPNPFLGYNKATNPFASSNQLSLVDGGEDLQNIPFSPLIQPIRAVDVIFAVDSSADTEFNWPNGTSLRASYDRSFGFIANGTLFPPVPDANTFINQGLNNRPTFFGCNASNFTISEGQSVPPLVVYLPNAPYTTNSNVSTFTPSYTLAQRNAIITNGYNSGTQSNATLDKNWPACMACAILSRSLARTGTSVPDQCTNCFDHYCWNGTIDSQTPAPYEPPFKTGNDTTATSSASSAVRTHGSEAGALTWMGLATLSAVVALVMLA